MFFSLAFLSMTVLTVSFAQNAPNITESQSEKEKKPEDAGNSGIEVIFYEE